MHPRSAVLLLVALTLVAVSGIEAFSVPKAFSPEGLTDWLCEDKDTCLTLAQLKTESNLHKIFHLVLKRAQSSVTDMVHPSNTDNTLPSWMPEVFRTPFRAIKKHIGASLPADASSDAVAEKLLEILKNHGAINSNKNNYSYFGFLPDHEGNLVPGATSATTFSTSCFDYSAQLAYVAGSNKQQVKMTITASNQKALFCSDFFYIGSAFGRSFEFIDAATTKTSTWNTSSTDSALLWDLQNFGARVYRFPNGPLAVVGDLLSTVTMMSGFAQMPLKKATLAANVDFLNGYVAVAKDMLPKYTPRPQPNAVYEGLNTSHIKSGDSFIVLRMDGLDPMIAWAEGWTSGHSVMAMRIPASDEDLKLEASGVDAGVLHVCESTAKDAYWPHNGIQCTEYHQWIKQAQAAEFQVLLAPLSAQARANFDKKKARDFYNRWAGQNYGYANMLYGWLDTHTQNMPCLPPDYKRCFSRTLAQSVFMLGDLLLGDNNINMFRQGMNHRVGTKGLSVLETIKTASEKFNWTFMDTVIQPEQDSWVYNMTCNNGTVITDGKCMVCNVFVCHMWKHGGVFKGMFGLNDDEINCSEQTLWNVYSMKIYDPERTGANRPSVCKTTDPTNELCQLVGPYTLNAVPFFNTRNVTKLMGQSCPSMAPKYDRPLGC